MIFITAISLLSGAILYLNQAQQASPELSQDLPIDSKVRIGKLENGLSFYIRENRKPENRAHFRLVINAGSLLEDEDQRGLAHFLEHMAFNGTEHFEKLELVDFLESIGMRFGADLNAYTSFDETVYFLEVPMDDEEILRNTFLVLKDWASAIQFEEEEINKERGVVVEEWRQGRGAQGRVRDAQIPVIFHDSQYAVRLPIGEVDVIESAPRDAFLRYYNTWYRPELMAVVAVGDFDANEIEKRITDTFGVIKPRPDAPERPVFEVPDHEETLTSIVTDPELSYTTIQIVYKHESEKVQSVSDYRQGLVENLYTVMLNSRLNEKVQEADPPFLYAGMGRSAMVRSRDVVVQTAVVREGEFARGLTALLLEARRCEAFGFTATELARAKADVIRSYEQSYAEREKTESQTYAAEYARHYLTDEPIPGIEFETELAKREVPGISLEEVNRVAEEWITTANRVILYSGPKKEGLKHPTEKEILDVMEGATKLEIEPYDDGSLAEPLISEEPVAGHIVSKQHWEDLGLTEWLLSNGVRVLLKPTDFKNDEVLLTSFSPGGDSLVSDGKYIPAGTATMVLGQSGLGHYDLVGLQKKLAGKIVSASPFINELYEGIRGSASPQDLETLFELVYLYFTEPRADPKAFTSIQVQLKEMIRNRINQPEAVFADKIEKVFFQDHPRHQPWSETMLKQMDLQASLDFYKQRFADAGDFTFVLVGAFEIEEVKPHILSYLGGLPSKDRDEKGIDVGDRPVEGKINIEVEKGLEPKSRVSIYFHGPAEWNTENRYALDCAVGVLRIRLREVLREEQGGVYGVSVGGSLSREPRETFFTQIGFGCDPGRADELTEFVLDEIKRLQDELPPADTLEKVKEMQLRSFEKGMKENPFWLSNLSFYAQNSLDFRSILEFPEKPKNLKPEQVQEAFKAYFVGDNVFIAKLVPEKSE